MFNRDFIKENIPPYEATSIGVYDNKGNEVGQVPLFYFKKERGEHLYSFGALSDVHNKNDQSAESTADLQRALRLFNDREDVVFTCISGDLTETATEEEFKIYQNNIQTCSPDTPVYATPGNHDCYGSGLNLELWKQYTGCERTYEVTYNGDHFLFLGMNKWSMGSSSCTPYLMEDLTWLAEKLEAYRNERCFIFTHLFFPKHAGNLKDIYPPANWLMGTQHDFLKDLLNRYPNTIWFSGHSHWKWYLQKYQDNANVERAGGWTVHIPSCATPIDSDGISTRVGKPLESEGAIIDVYENYIDIRGIDLKNDIYIPTAQYRLDTKLIEIGQNEYEVTLNLNNVTVSNASNKIKANEAYTNKITSTADGSLIITVTMGGVDITSDALNGNTISISKATGDIVITAMVAVGFSTDLLTTCDVKLNQRWSASSGVYSAQDGVLVFTVPYSEIQGRTIKLVGFTEEHDGRSTWYAYESSGNNLGRIANNTSGVVWDVASLVNNGDGSYDLPISPEIFMKKGTASPLTEIPHTIYITMHASSSAITSTDGFRILVSDSKEEPDEPEVNPDEPEGFSTDLLKTCDVKLNKRWSASSNAYSDKDGTIAFSVPFKDIDGRTIKIMGFSEENKGISTWYAYKGGNVIGRIADGNIGTVWTSSSLVDNGNGSYDLPVSKKIFMKPNTQTTLSDNPDTIYITMCVNEDTKISSIEGLKMLLSDLN